MGASESRATAIARRRANRRTVALEANRAYQATRLYSTPPVFGERDERRETGNYGLTHLATTMTQRRCFYAIVHWLLPSEASMLQQTRKVFSSVIEAAEEQLVRYLHELHYSRAVLPFAAIGHQYTRYLHDMSGNISSKCKKKKILLLSGSARSQGVVPSVHMMTIIDDEEESTRSDEDGHYMQVSWHLCAPLTTGRFLSCTHFLKGEVLMVGGFCEGRPFGTCERYDVLSQTQVETEAEVKEEEGGGGGGEGGGGKIEGEGAILPITQLEAFAFAELSGVLFVIGGTYYEPGRGRPTYANVVYCLDTKRERSIVGNGRGSLSSHLGGEWVEQEERIATARCDAAATAFEGKLWLAGGRNISGQYLSDIEVFDPFVRSWQAAGNLTTPRRSLTLLVINNELYAAGFDNTEESTSIYKSRGCMFIEQRDRHSGAWRLISEHNDSANAGCVRDGCCVVACGSSIYFLGGYGASSWNRFDTASCSWLSQEKNGTFRKDEERQLPRMFYNGQAACITPNEVCSWTGYPGFAH